MIIYWTRKPQNQIYGLGTILFPGLGSSPPVGTVYNFTVSVIDSLGNTGSRAYSLTIFG